MQCCRRFPPGVTGEHIQFLKIFAGTIVPSVVGHSRTVAPFKLAGLGREGGEMMPVEPAIAPAYVAQDRCVPRVAVEQPRRPHTADLVGELLVGTPALEASKGRRTCLDPDIAAVR